MHPASFWVKQTPHSTWGEKRHRHQRGGIREEMDQSKKDRPLSQSHKAPEDGTFCLLMAGQHPLKKAPLFPKDVSKKWSRNPHSSLWGIPSLLIPYIASEKIISHHCSLAKSWNNAYILKSNKNQGLTKYSKGLQLCLWATKSVREKQQQHRPHWVVSSKQDNPWHTLSTTLSAE